jgi:two-component system sensor histidine kinase DesK
VLHVPFAAVAPLFVITRQSVTAGEAVLAVVAAAAIGGLQLRHSVAAARGERPAGGLWTFCALVALVYLPLWWFGADWMVVQWFVMASGAMILRGPAAAVAVAAPIIGTVVATSYLAAGVFPAPGLSRTVIVSIDDVTALATGGASLYGSAWLVRVLDDRDSPRTELADLAVEWERLRVSRDLHDLLGKSLSAVSLKGDVALRLIRTDVAAARTEIDGITGLARRALHEVRAVTSDEHAVSLATEIAAACALLGAAGIVTDVEVDLPDLAHPAEEVLAWAVREGATNVLRHSRATRWTLTGGRPAGRVFLEMVNDGAQARTGHGRGLAGIHERAQAVSGSVVTERTADGRFRLHVGIPEGGS